MYVHDKIEIFVSVFMWQQYASVKNIFEEIKVAFSNKKALLFKCSEECGISICTRQYPTGRPRENLAIHAMGILIL